MIFESLIDILILIWSIHHLWISYALSSSLSHFISRRLHYRMWITLRKMLHVFIPANFPVSNRAIFSCWRLHIGFNSRLSRTCPSSSSFTIGVNYIFTGLCVHLCLVYRTFNFWGKLKVFCCGNKCFIVAFGLVKRLLKKTKIKI